MKNLPLLLLILLSFVFLTLVVPLFVLHPSLYTNEENAFTPYHSNPAILGGYSGERSADVSSLMQELLDAPQPIVLNVKVSDFEEAERALEEYKEKSQYFNQVIINLDLTDSTIGDLQRENRKNLAELESIINESMQFDQINRLEIQYRSQDNPALLYTVTYEGEAVRKAIEKSAKEYLDREPKILALSNQLDLNTTKYNESDEILKEIVEMDQVKQETRILNQPVLSPSSLSLAVSPESGHYGDTLQVDGAYTFMHLPNVTLILDSRDWKTVVPDQNGVFGSPFTIGRIRSGDHTIFATSNNRNSNIATFSVVPVDTNLTLDTLPGKYWNEVNINGSLYAGVLPVASAPVMILVDEFDVQTFETNQEGYYDGMLLISAGNHTIQSSFDDTAFPLNPTVSDIHTITVSSPGRILWSVLIGAGIILVSIFVSVWYLRRSDQWAKSISSEYPQPEMVHVSVETMEKTPFQAEVLVRYQTLFDDREWSEAAHLLYRSFIERINFLHVGPDPSAMTPRELFIILSKSFPGAPIRSFINRYEEIRYGGYPLLQQDPLLTDWIKIISRIAEEGNE
jgi:hypothetical protein